VGDKPADLSALTEDLSAQAPSKPAKPPGGSLSPEEEKAEADYTSRLLKAKKKMWDEREK
jgi:hypothetical protein